MEFDRSENAKENLAPSRNESHEVLYNQLESRYECPICLNWLQEPALTSCGHRFCKACILSWLEQSGHCPIDNIALADGDIFPDNYTRREILEKRTSCPFKDSGCLEQIPALEVKAHMDVCPFAKMRSAIGVKTIQCTFKNLGCDKVFKNEADLNQHLESSMQQHLNLLLNACVNLNPKNSLSRSSSDAKEQEAMCLWEPNEKRKEGESDNNQASSVNGLIRALYERVIVLEQRNREQDIVLNNLTRQMTALSVNHHKISNELPLRYCMGTYIWKIDNFKAELSAMTLDPMKMLYSQGFFTSPCGYKFCARINVSSVNPQCLSLHVHTMKSGHDDTLDWPFSGRISFVMVHPMRSELSQKDTMMSRTELVAFQRPTSDICLRGFGYTEYALINDVFQKSYVQNDRLVIKIKIQPV